MVWVHSPSIPRQTASTTVGFAYDAAGNQIRTMRADGQGQHYRVRCTGRLANVLNENGALVEAYGYYDASNLRLRTQFGDKTLNPRYYVWDGYSVIAELEDVPRSAPAISEGGDAGSLSFDLPPVDHGPFERLGKTSDLRWARTYIYLGGRLLSTMTPNSTGEIVQYHHPDRLSTRLITNAANTDVLSQETLPFGVEAPGVSSEVNNQKFTTYDRSMSTGLDYAVNRTYDSWLGRFMQPDPLGMTAARLENPQSPNMYTYVGNNPVNVTDPLGLQDGKIEARCEIRDGFMICYNGANERIYVGQTPPGFGSTGSHSDAVSSDGGASGSGDSGYSLWSSDSSAIDFGIDEAKEPDPYSNSGMVNCGTLCTTSYWFLVDSLFGRTLHTVEIGIANVVAQAAFTGSEIVMGWTVRPIAYAADYHLGVLDKTTLWEFQSEFNELYRHTWHGYSFYTTPHD